MEKVAGRLTGRHFQIFLLWSKSISWFYSYEIHKMPNWCRKEFKYSTGKLWHYKNLPKTLDVQQWKASTNRLEKSMVSYWNHKHHNKCASIGETQARSSLSWTGLHQINQIGCNCRPQKRHSKNWTIWIHLEMCSSMGGSGVLDQGEGQRSLRWVY